MKKILFGTSALVAASLFSGAALAEDCLNGCGDDGIVHGVPGDLGLTVSGFADFGIGYQTVDPDNNREQMGIVNDGEIHFNAKGTLENGLTFGGKVELEAWGASAGGDMIDEAMGYVEGSFGRFEIGEEDGADDRLGGIGLGVGCKWACAYDSGGYVIDRAPRVSSDFGFGSSDSGDSLKVSYFTPSFSGFKAGVSYAPNNVENGTNNTGLDTGGEVWEGGLQYSNTWDAFNFGIGAGASYFSNGIDGNGDGATAWGVSGKVGYGGFELGLAYEDSDDELGDELGFGGGIGYSTGPWMVGAAVGFADENDGMAVSGNVNYILGPGVETGVSVEYVTTDPNGRNNDTNAFGGAVWLGLDF